MQRLDQELEKRIKDKVKETVDKINQHFGLDMPIPHVHYDVRGTTAGIAKYRSMSVHLNPTLLLQNIEDSVNVTVPHEVCHLTTFYKYMKEGRMGVPKPHGAEWKLMMWVAGASPKTTHTYDVQDVQTKKVQYLYVCGCSEGMKVSQGIHTRIKKGSRYQCRKCKVIIHSGQRILKHGESRL